MKDEYKKDFDGWNDVKKDLDRRDISNVFFREREIWWCSLGKNIGREQNGKGQNFRRPVLIAKIVSSDLAYIIPLTSSIRDGKYRSLLVIDGVTSQLMLDQIRIISTKRLIQKMDKIKRHLFLKIIFELAIISLNIR